MKKIIFSDRREKLLKEVPNGEIFLTVSDELFIKTDGMNVDCPSDYIPCVRMKNGSIINLCEESTTYELETEVKCTFQETTI